MFTNLSYLKKHTPENGTDRESYLSLLVDEYLNSSSLDSKSQVLANLANFAYDPINFAYIRDVGVFDVFLYVIKNECNIQLLHFATTGICNLCSDPVNLDYLIEHSGVKSLVVLLNSNHTEIIPDIIATFIYLFNNGRRTGDNTEIMQKIETLKQSQDKVISNLATVFMDIYQEQ
ncbi:unnamed protein product [Leptosia nina]|uniref:Armadillo repeat-containing protein 7 n=1 Tax=Leptosia nina TaxID=320188 RepID=A0AAV1JGZ4_9NEOP